MLCKSRISRNNMQNPNNTNEAVMVNPNEESNKTPDMDCLPPPQQNNPADLQNLQTENPVISKIIPEKNVKLTDQQFQDFIEIILNLSAEQKTKLHQALTNDAINNSNNINENNIKINTTPKKKW